MSDTKENILSTALRLFAQDGYEAVSMSRIAGELGMTKGALYKHYKNKRDIFDKIFEHVCQLDAERSQKAGITNNDFDGTTEAFTNTSIESVKAFMEPQFRYWAEDEITCNFRKMLTLEQYRNPKMMNLYQEVLAGGPVEYIENLFCEMMKQGVWKQGNPKQMAVEFFAPLYLLLSISDAATSKKEKEEIVNLFMTHIDSFIERYAREKPQEHGGA